MNRVLLPFPGQRPLAGSMAPLVEARLGHLAWRRFPDGESLVAVDEGLLEADVAVVASLDHPDETSMALRFAASVAREFGARSVGLVAPYLAYMRQDARFHPGEAVGARLYARFLEDSFDWLVTLDPHLHRIHALAELFRMPAIRVAAAPVVAEWIAKHVDDAVLIGPDSESGQWVGDIARRAGLPWQVLEKRRAGDLDVEVTLPDLAAVRGRTPVLVDDIISTGRTLLQTIRQLRRLALPDPVCIAIHGVFSGDAYQALRDAGAARIVSTDSIPHETNAIGIADLLADACAGLFERGRKPHG